MEHQSIWSANKDGFALNDHTIQIENLSGAISLRRGQTATEYLHRWERVEIVNEQILLRHSAHDIDLELRMQPGSPLRLSGSVRVTGGHPIHLEQIVLRIGEIHWKSPVESLSFFKNGYQSWSESRTFAAGESEAVGLIGPLNAMQTNLRNLPVAGSGGIFADSFGILGDPHSGWSVLIGQGGGFEQEVHVRARLDPSQPRAGLDIVWDFGGALLLSRESRELDPVVLLAAPQAWMALEQYAQMTRTNRKLPESLPSGWCSWYYYFQKVREQDILENATVIFEEKPGWDTFVIDDGYEKAVGDWLTPSNKFAGGLARPVGAVRAAGMQPGLWLAPFIAHRTSELFRRHPDWFLRDPHRKPVLAGINPNWGSDLRFYALDVTHPEVQDYVREVVRTAINIWGFRYLKLDFLYAAALPGEATNRGLTPAQRMKLGYRLVREAAGEDIFLLGCGSPLGPALGFVDAMRIGPDVAPYWYDPLRIGLTRDPHALCTRSAVRSILARAGLHREWWLNDPDCLMLRDKNTRLSLDERMTLVNAAIITGGMVMFSDRLSVLPDSTWEQMGRIVKLAKECDSGRAVILDLLEREFPRLAYNRSGFLAVFNPADRVENVDANLIRYLPNWPVNCVLKEVWSEETLPVHAGDLHIMGIPAHGSRLYRVEPA